MTNFKLVTKIGNESINITKVKTRAEAICVFSMVKDLSEKDLLELFYVVRDK